MASKNSDEIVTNSNSPAPTVQTPVADILIVDDTPNNLRLLSEILSDNGYKVRKAPNGRWALQAVEIVPPDLILLDIRMPEMDGYEVCRRLKASSHACDIPVIFISALDDATDKVHAFEVGGVDYITKPFQVHEVLARVSNHLNIQRLQQQLKAQNTQLQEEIRERQKAESGLRVFLHAVSHDLRNPVTGMSMVLNNLLSAADTPDSIPIPRAVLDRMANSCDRQLNLIESLLETQHGEIWGISLDRQRLPLHTLTQNFVAEWQPMLQKRKATIEHRVPEDLPPLQFDRNQLWRVFENLLANALKHNPPGLNLTLSAQLDPDANCVRCTLADDGVGMTPEQCAQLFEPYTRGKSAKRMSGLGLGLYLCRQIIAAHGGEIGAVSQPGEGATFWFTLPLNPPEKSPV